MKRQIKLYADEETENLWTKIKALYPSGTAAFAAMVHDHYFRDKTNWWWWAIQSPAGTRAIQETGVQVDLGNPARGVPEPNFKGYWRAQPFCNPGEDWTGRSWETKIAELRAELDEQAGVFYVEHIDYRIGAHVQPGNQGWPQHTRDHGFLFAVSDDGKRAVYRQVIGDDSSLV